MLDESLNTDKSENIHDSIALKQQYNISFRKFLCFISTGSEVIKLSGDETRVVLLAELDEEDFAQQWLKLDDTMADHWMNTETAMCVQALEDTISVQECEPNTPAQEWLV